MSDLKESVLRDFDAYCRELNIGSDDAARARVFVAAEVDSFLQQETSVGIGKTRRPSFNHKFFAEQIARVAEVKRREREDLSRLFGEH